MRIIGYCYEAGYHCPDCAQERFGQQLKDNEAQALYSFIDLGEEPYCDDCLEAIGAWQSLKHICV